MKSKIFCAMVALAMVFSACNKDLPGQLADEGELGVKKWVFDDQETTWLFGYSQISASDFGNYKGDGKFNNGVNVKVIDGVYLHRGVFVDGKWVEDNGNGPVFMTFNEPKSGAWDCTAPLYVVVKYKASINVSIEFNLTKISEKYPDGYRIELSEINAWGPVTQVRYGEIPDAVCCKTFEIKFYKSDKDYYAGKVEDVLSKPAGPMITPYLFELGEGKWVTDGKVIESDMIEYFNLLPCQIAGGFPDGYPDHSWVQLFDVEGIARPFGSAIIGCPDVIHVFPVWKDCQPDPVYRKVFFFKNEATAKASYANEDAKKLAADAYFEILDGTELDVSYFYKAGLKPGYWKETSPGVYALDMDKLLAHFNTCAEVLPSQKWTTDADGVFPSQAPYRTVNKDLDLFNSYDPCPVEKFKVQFFQRNNGVIISTQYVETSADINWKAFPDPEFDPAGWNAAGAVFDGTWYYRDGSWKPWVEAHGTLPAITGDIDLAPGWIDGIDGLLSEGAIPTSAYGIIAWAAFDGTHPLTEFVCDFKISSSLITDQKLSNFRKLRLPSKKIT